MTDELWWEIYCETPRCERYLYSVSVLATIRDNSNHYCCTKCGETMRCVPSYEGESA